MTYPDYDLIIFDCDGVLVDSEVISAQTLIALLQPFGIDFDLPYMCEHFLGRSFPTVAATIRREHAVDLPADFELSYRKTLLKTFQTDLKPMDGIHDVLTRLQTRYCVASSSSPERVHRSLSIVGLKPYFEGAVFTASEVAHGKPAPDLFLHAAADRGVDPSRCLVIEDSVSGIEAAHAAGMTVWRYTGGAHLSGTHASVSLATGVIPSFDSWSNFAHMIGQDRKIRMD